jgi:predicted transposase YdaD
MMSKADRIAYERHLDAIMVQEDVLTTAKTEGFAEGREEGLAEGREEGFAKGKEEGFAKGKEEGREKGREEGERANAMAVAKRLKERGIDWHIIADSTGLAEADIKAL